MAPESQPSELLEILTGIRLVHEQMLARALENGETAATCMHAVVLLHTAIESWAPQYQPRIRGGDGAQDGGFFTTSGYGYEHYWVELVGDDGAPWVADITGDQFGWVPVQLSTAAAVEGVYVPGDQAVVDAHVAEFMKSMKPGR